MTKLMSLLLLTLMAAPAHALIEARLTYGLLASTKAELADLRTSAVEVPSIVPNYGLGADALVFIPMTGLGLGLRYENLGLKAKDNGLEYKSTATRTAVLASYRLINTFLHLGPIFSYGLSHTNKMDVSDASTGQSFNWKPDSTSSYQIGLEAGVGLLAFVVGGEVGYENMKWKKMKDSSGNSSSTPDIDMSGTYGKVYLGFSI